MGLQYAARPLWRVKQQRNYRLSPVWIWTCRFLLLERALTAQGDRPSSICALRFAQSHCRLQDASAELLLILVDDKFVH